MKVGGRLLLVVGLTAGLGLSVVFLAPRSPAHGFFDLTIYRGAGRWWLDGHPLYAYIRPHTTSFGFTYPPFALLCLLPLALLPGPAAAAVLTALSVALVVLTTWWLVVPVADRHGWPRGFALALAVPVTLAMEPVRETLGWGQIGLLLVALVLADVRALERGRAWAGVGIGLATAIKLTPGLFAVYLLLSGRIRAAATAVATFVAVTLLAWLVDPAASTRYWTDLLWQVARVGRADRTENQSLFGALSRLAEPAAPDRRLWLVLAGVVLALGMVRAVRAGRRGDEIVGVTLTGLVACLISPISWNHHLYWVVPAALVLIDVAAGAPLQGSGRPWIRAVAGAAAAVVIAAFVCSLIWFFARPQGAHASAGLLGMLGENSYVLIMIALVLLLPVREVSGAAPSSARSPARARPAGSSPR
ncbi:MAG: glycosyltransferase 87 family protein [Blastococcus sp.]